MPERCAALQRVVPIYQCIIKHIPHGIAIAVEDGKMHLFYLSTFSCLFSQAIAVNRLSFLYPVLFRLTTSTSCVFNRRLAGDYCVVANAMDPWMREHVLNLTETPPVDLVQNRTVSLERLAKRQPDVVVFADASTDRKSYLLAFGRIAPRTGTMTHLLLGEKL